MDINKLVQNLENTIAGKQLYLSSLNGNTLSTIRELVRINIDELSRILKDAREVQRQFELYEEDIDNLIEEKKHLEADLDGFVHGN